jgi:hypothetical protein
MKFSTRTLDILKNFSTINSGIVVKQGSRLRTMSAQKNILAEANVDETFPVDFAIYDLTSLIGLLSMNKDESEIDFDTNQLTIRGYSGRSRTSYRFTSKELVISPPDKDLVLPTEDAKFTLSADDFNHLQKVASVLQSPQMIVQAESGKLYMHTVDLQNDSANTMRLEIGDTDASDFRVVLRTENMKLMPATYNVTVTLKGFTRFESADGRMRYWISTEATA